MNGIGYSGKPDAACQACGMCCRGEDPDVPLGGKPDPCLGILPDVIQACCGHGCDVDEDGWSPHPYVVIAPGHAPGTPVWQAENAVCLRFDAALDWFAERGVGPRAAVRPAVETNS